MEMPTPVLSPDGIYLGDNGIYLGDNGRVMCTSCAGMSALYTGKDLSGWPVSRFSVADMCPLQGVTGRDFTACECGKVRITTEAGPDGWPLRA